MSQLALILDWNRLDVVFQKLLLRFWNVDPFPPQLLFSLLSEGTMVGESFVAQVDVFQGGVIFIDALKVRVVDVGLGRLRNLESQRYSDAKKLINMIYDFSVLTDFL